MHHFDVIIVGAGISGIGAARRLRDECPDKAFAILEGRDSIGGTWDLFRYPGVRSDSDMYTMGYASKPWRDPKAIADGASILAYVKEAAAECGIVEHIHFGHRVTSADWCGDAARWTVEAERAEAGDRTQFTCNFLFMCSGYYSYEKGYTPEFEGVEDFQGQAVHPQRWPEDLDYTGKRVVVIGSGATAMTLVPAMAGKAAQVIMLQRSPTYLISMPATDPIAQAFQRVFPKRLAYRLTRWKNIQIQRYIYRQTRVRPDRVKQILVRLVRKHLGPDYDVEKHFTPRYGPWDQRLCLVPDGDLFRAIQSGKAVVVTDQVERFTTRGLKLKSGQELEADIIVTATGLDLVVLGGARFSVDGEPVNFAETYAYRGMMFSDVPNLAHILGYINTSWTLRAELVAEYVCRLLNHMDALNVRQCTPHLRDQDEGMETRPMIDDFSPGYIRRAIHLLPKQGDRDPWRTIQNYTLEKKMMRHVPLEDGVMIFSNPADAAEPTESDSLNDKKSKSAA